MHQLCESDFDMYLLLEGRVLRVACAVANSKAPI